MFNHAPFQPHLRSDIQKECETASTHTRTKQFFEYMVPRLPQISCELQLDRQIKLLLIRIVCIYYIMPTHVRKMGRLSMVCGAYSRHKTSQLFERNTLLAKSKQSFQVGEPICYWITNERLINEIRHLRTSPSSVDISMVHPGDRESEVQVVRRWLD